MASFCLYTKTGTHSGKVKRYLGRYMDRKAFEGSGPGGTSVDGVARSAWASQAIGPFPVLH